MKNFDQFILEGVGDKVGGMSDDQFNQFMKGRTDKEAQTYRDARDKARGNDKKKKEPKQLNPSAGGALALRKDKSTDQTSPSTDAGKTTTKASGLSAKPRSFNSTSVPPKPERKRVDRYVPRSVTPEKTAAETSLTGKEKDKVGKDKDKKKKGKGLELGKKLKDVAKALKDDTKKDIETYEAKPIA